MSMTGVNESLLDQVKQIRIIHQALGHLGESALREHIEARNRAVTINKDNNRNMRSIRKVIPKHAITEYFRIFGQCTTCLMGKMTSDQNHWRSTHLPKEVGEVMHVDWTFYNVSNNYCFMVSIDDLSGYVHIVHSLNKSPASHKQYGHTISSVYSDNDSAYNDDSLGANGVFVKNETSGAHNSTIERFNRTWENIARAFMLDMGIAVPDALMHKLLKFACDSFNMRQSKCGESPFYKFHGREHSYELTNQTEVINLTTKKFSIRSKGG